MYRRPKVFLDTNIIMDILKGDRPSSPASTQILQFIRSGKLEGQICSQSIVDSAYLCARDRQNFQPFSQAVRFMLDYINLNSIDYISLNQALLNPRDDFEDAALYACAKDSCCDAFITHDKDFRRRYEGEDPHIRFFTPEELVSLMTE